MIFLNPQLGHSLLASKSQFEMAGGDGACRRVDGHIDPGRAEVLGNLTVIHEQEGVTTLEGPVEDQAALYGIIVRLRDMGLELLDVQRIETDTDSEAEIKTEED
jgi:hypothetical protein